MLRFFVNFIEKLEEGRVAVLAKMRSVKADFHEALSDIDADFRTYDVEFEPITAISHDAPVMQVVASKKPDYSKMSLAKLRNAYVKAFDEQPDGRWKEAKLRGYLEEAE